MELRELVRLEVVVHLAVDHRREPGVGQARHRSGGVGGQVSQGLEHLRGPRGAVEPDDVDVHGLEGDQGGAHLGTRKHRPGQLDGDLALDGEAHPGTTHGPARTVDGRLGLEEIEHRLHQDQVGAALDERGRLLLVGVPQVGVADLAERRELGARTDAARHPSGPVRRHEVVGRPSRQGHGGQVEFADPVTQAVLGEHRGEGAEGVGLHDVAAHLVERSVDLLDGVGPGHDQQLVAPFELRSAEVLGSELLDLQVGSHGPVEHDDPFACGLEVARFGA